MADNSIAFMDVRTFENGNAIRGAILVTDAATEPQEFRCTSAIRPTRIQRTLWGNRLSAHVATSLVGIPLLEAISNSISLIVIQSPDFLEIRPSVQIPVVQLLRNEELAKASPLAVEEREDDLLTSEGGTFEPVIIKVHRKFLDDRTTAQDLLRDPFRNHSLLEPFERIANALDLVHQQDAENTG